MDFSTSVTTCVLYFNQNGSSAGLFVLQLWRSWENFLQEKWDQVLQSTGEDSFKLYVFASTALFIVLYCVIGAHYVVLDITNKPAALLRYKTQPGANEPLNRRQLLNALPLICFNLTVVNFAVGCCWYWILKMRGVPPLRQLPTLGCFLTDLVIFVLLEEFGMYYLHRLLHSSYLYKHVHKRHHEWTSPVAVTAIYCHSFEHVIVNMSPVLLGPLVMASHVTTLWIWIIIVTFTTMNAHSGYHFPFLPSPEFHDFHHRSFTQCYGVLGLLDWLHGTDSIFRKSKYYERHRTIFCLSSAREMVTINEQGRQPVTGGYFNWIKLT